MEPLSNLKVATHERLLESQHKIVEIEDQDAHLLKNNTKNRILHFAMCRAFTTIRALIYLNKCIRRRDDKISD